MQAISNNKSRAFSNRRISVDQAIRVLRKSGIDVNEEQAATILDFLYLIAKTTTISSISKRAREVEH